MRTMKILVTFEVDTARVGKYHDILENIKISKI